MTSMDLFSKIEAVLGTDAIDPDTLLTAKQVQQLKHVFTDDPCDVTWPIDDKNLTWSDVIEMLPPMIDEEELSDGEAPVFENEENVGSHQPIAKPTVRFEGVQATAAAEEEEDREYGRQDSDLYRLLKEMKQLDSPTRRRSSRRQSSLAREHARKEEAVAAPAVVQQPDTSELTARIAEMGSQLMEERINCGQAREIAESLHAQLTSEKQKTEILMQEIEEIQDELEEVLASPSWPPRVFMLTVGLVSGLLLGHYYWTPTTASE